MTPASTATASEIASRGVAMDERFVYGTEADGHEYYATGVFDVSPDHRLLAHAGDITGGEVYTLRFRDLETGADLPGEIEGVYYGSAWSTDGRHFFYTRPDEAMRPYQVWRHELGTDPATDVLVFEEPDERFYLSVDLGRDERYLYIHAGSKVTDEVWFVEADRPTEPFRVVQPREQGIEYGVSHHRGRFLILTNADGAENFKLCEVPVATPGRAAWTDVIPHRPEVKLSGITTFVDHLVVYERVDATTQIRVRRLSDGDEHTIEQPEAVGTEKVTLDITPEAIAEVARIAAQVNESVENIGARRLQTVMERLLEELSFEAEDRAGESVMIDADYVREKLSGLAQDADLSKYIL